MLLLIPKIPTPKRLIISLTLLGLTSSLSPFPAAMAQDLGMYSVAEAIRDTRGYEEAAGYEAVASKKHETVAEYYEDDARKMRAKAQEQKLLLEHYSQKSYLYGKKALDLQAHAAALVRKYEQAASADESEAASHRKIAAKLKETMHTAVRINRLNEPQ